MRSDVFSVMLDPAVLFFLLGVLAAAVRSNLEMPAQISKFISLYLLMAIGIKGGVALSVSGIHRSGSISGQPRGGTRWPYGCGSRDHGGTGCDHGCVTGRYDALFR